MSTILSSDRDHNFVFSGTEIRILAIKLMNTHGIEFDEEKFIKYLKENNTLAGFARQVRKLGQVDDKNAIIKLAAGDLNSVLKLDDSDLRSSSSVIRIAVEGLLS